MLTFQPNKLINSQPNLMSDYNITFKLNVLNQLTNCQNHVIWPNNNYYISHTRCIFFCLLCCSQWNGDHCCWDIGQPAFLSSGFVSEFGSGRMLPQEVGTAKYRVLTEAEEQWRGNVDEAVQPKDYLLQADWDFPIYKKTIPRPSWPAGWPHRKSHTSGSSLGAHLRLAERPTCSIFGLQAWQPKPEKRNQTSAGGSTLP